MRRKKVDAATSPNDDIILSVSIWRNRRDGSWTLMRMARDPELRVPTAFGDLVRWTAADAPKLMQGLVLSEIGQYATRIKDQPAEYERWPRREQLRFEKANDSVTIDIRSGDKDLFRIRLGRLQPGGGRVGYPENERQGRLPLSDEEFYKIVAAAIGVK